MIVDNAPNTAPTAGESGSPIGASAPVLTVAILAVTLGGPQAVEPVEQEKQPRRERAGSTRDRGTDEQGRVFGLVHR